MKNITDKWIRKTQEHIAELDGMISSLDDIIQIEQKMLDQQKTDHTTKPEIAERLEELDRLTQLRMKMIVEKQAQTNDDLRRLTILHIARISTSWLFKILGIVVVFLTLLSVKNVITAIELQGPGSSTLFSINITRALIDILGTTTFFLALAEAMFLLFILASFFISNKQFFTITSQITKLAFEIALIAGPIVGLLLSMTDSQISLVSSIVSLLVVFMVLLKKQISSVQSELMKASDSLFLTIKKILTRHSNHN
ncbi:hypothetical protein [Schleiferilactobacillus harbinensis]|jgi:hypothetical protein|uniref:hypothetical protein n=1 Tax=Schleiferilactobacillus harbinensis TaxID=304207 RepID=UPI00242D13E1|nr:hypothetical protein [Schleiferilactobacillus harbinensis]MCI1851054.1 hypothetical protein [Schleiferilactobacillus harbinensis]